MGQITIYRHGQNFLRADWGLKYDDGVEEPMTITITGIPRGSAVARSVAVTRAIVVAMATFARVVTLVLIIVLVASASIVIAIAIAAFPCVSAGIIKMATHAAVTLSILVADRLGHVAEFAHI
jgi:hypothetical protein